MIGSLDDLLSFDIQVKKESIIYLSWPYYKKYNSLKNYQFTTNLFTVYKVLSWSKATKIMEKFQEKPVNKSQKNRQAEAATT